MTHVVGKPNRGVLSGDQIRRTIRCTQAADRPVLEWILLLPPGSERYKRYRWVYPSGTIIDGYQRCSAVPLSIGFNPMGATSSIARRCFHRDELSGEPAKDPSLCSCHLLPPSGQARMEGCGFEPSKPFTASSRDKPSFFRFRARTIASNNMLGSR